MITVLLATYNGRRFIGEQLDSLLNQTYKDFKVLIHDDGSTDGTADIIDGYIARYPDKFSRIEAPATGSAAANFAFLFSKCDDDYIMFCDQDDVWMPEKIEKTLAAVKAAEAETDADVPVLAHSDLAVTDAALNIINDSFFAMQKLDPDFITLPHLLVQNCVTGCTVMINRALKERTGEIPKECAMHDWWLALVAAVFGKTVFINEPLLYYRQHGDNSVGAKSAGSLSYITGKLKNLENLKSNYLMTYVQARILRQRYIKEADPISQKIINAYCNMSELGKLGRIRLMRLYGFQKNTRLRRIGQYIIV